jgi:hypothetical protein
MKKALAGGMLGLDLVVEYSSTANTHPEGVRLVVLKTPPE